MTATTFTIPTLETERLIMRAFCEDDITFEKAFLASEDSRFVGGPMPPHRAWRSIAMVTGHWALRGFGLWALEDKETGQYVGRVGLWYPDGWIGREIGWTLMPHAWGKGLATEAAMASRAHAYDVLGWDTAISCIAPENTASKAVARRLGASFEKFYEEPEYGTTEIWRHPAPDTLVNGGMEAYA